jgi:hypothetical protein
VLEGRLPEQRIVPCQPCGDLDALPTVDYSEFYRLVADVILLDEANQKNMWIPYETSRGCWYGQKQQCRFCGINGPSIRFREKSEARVMAELRELLAGHPSRNVSMSDCNMPQRYFQTLLPRLAEELPGLQVFYELKASLSLAWRRSSGAGIIALSARISRFSACLKLMNKGSPLGRTWRSQNARRWILSWNILCGIPSNTIAPPAGR